MFLRTFCAHEGVFSVIGDLPLEGLLCRTHSTFCLYGKCGLMSHIYFFYYYFLK